MFHNKKSRTLNSENAAWVEELKLALVGEEELIPVVARMVATNHMFKLMVVTKEDQSIKRAAKEPDDGLYGIAEIFSLATLLSAAIGPKLNEDLLTSPGFSRGLKGG